MSGRDKAVDIINKIDILKKTIPSYKGLLVGVDDLVFFNAERVVLTENHLEFYSKGELKAEVVPESIGDREVKVEANGDYINLYIES